MIAERQKLTKSQRMIVILTLGIVACIYVKMTRPVSASLEGAVGPIEYFYYPPTNGVDGSPFASCVLSNKSGRAITVLRNVTLVQETHESEKEAIFNSRSMPINNRSITVKKLPRYLKPGETINLVFQLPTVLDEDSTIPLSTNKLCFIGTWTGYFRSKVMENFFGRTSVELLPVELSVSKTFNVPSPDAQLKDGGIKMTP